MKKKAPEKQLLSSLGLPAVLQIPEIDSRHALKSSGPAAVSVESYVRLWPHNAPQNVCWCTLVKEKAS